MVQISFIIKYKLKIKNRNNQQQQQQQALSNQNSGNFQGYFLIFQGLKITEVQGSAILTHIFPLYKAHVTAQETATCSTETALGRPPHIILRFKNKAALG